MKNIKAVSILSLASILSAVPSMAYQKDEKGWYGYAGLGPSYLSDADVVVQDFGLEGTESHDVGMMTTAGLGFKYGNGFRTEFEYAYRSNTIGKYPPFITVVGGDGDPTYQSNSFMGNLLYEFRRNKHIRPYIGAGLGYSFLKNGKESDDQFVYQGIAGAFFKITDDIDLGVAYKYFDTFKTPVMNLNGNPAPADIEFPYNAHTIELRGILNF